jgi:hypothetical protein
LFSKEKEPIVIPPELTLLVPNNKAYEVGTVVTPAYEGVFTPGEYEFGPATGVVSSNWIASNNYSDEKIHA